MPDLHLLKYEDVLRGINRDPEKLEFVDTKFHSTCINRNLSTSFTYMREGNRAFDSTFICMNEQHKILQPKILLTGSRTWTDVITLRNSMVYWGQYWAGMFKNAGITKGLQDPQYFDFDVTTHFPAPILLVGDAARGADVMAELTAQELGWHVETYRADWTAFGKRAGILRNVKMVDAAPDLTLAFIRDESPGAMHCWGQAISVGIPGQAIMVDELTEAPLF